MNAERAKPLSDWLTANNGKMLWEHNNNFVIYQGWLLERNRFLIVTSSPDGWSIYTEYPGLGVPETLADANERLGLDRVGS